MIPVPEPGAGRRAARLVETGISFLKPGCVSFGGPFASFRKRNGSDVRYGNSLQAYRCQSSLWRSTQR